MPGRDNSATLTDPCARKDVRCDREVRCGRPKRADLRLAAEVEVLPQPFGKLSRELQILQ